MNTILCGHTGRWTICMAGARRQKWCVICKYGAWSAAGGASCCVHPISSSWFGSTTQDNQAFHPYGSTIWYLTCLWRAKHSLDLDHGLLPLPVRRTRKDGGLLACARFEPWTLISLYAIKWRFPRLCCLGKRTPERNEPHCKCEYMGNYVLKKSSR